MSAEETYFLVFLGCCNTNWPWQAIQHLWMYFIMFSGLLLGNLVPGVCYVMAGFQGHDCPVAALCQARPAYTGKLLKYFYTWQHTSVLLLLWPLGTHLSYPSRLLVFAINQDGAGIKQHLSVKLPLRLQIQERGKYMRGENSGCNKVHPEKGCR